ncbi:MAG TPA: hypothetical protein EYP17_02990, partial [Candidatus Latescibacteria bacterium]|nr:hypothetical protein [Candidatus Latescibacterota bacterium]
MKMFKLGAIVTYGGGAIKTLTEAAGELREEGVEVHVRAATPSSELGWEGFLRWLVEEAHAFFLLGGNPEEYDGLLKTLSAGHKVVVTKEPGRSTVSPEHVAKLERYYKYGGKENLKNFILYLGKLAGFDFRPREPEEVPWQGIYHPELGTFEEPGTYRLKYERSLGLRPKVGLLFYRSYWLDGNLALVDALVRELEGRGIGVVPVFGQGKDKKLGSEALKLLGGAEVVVSLRSFFLVPRDPAREESPLSTLNVPALQGLKEYYKTELVQPKRGCYGARCDGRVCKILHDPEIPPPHHWIATYKWIQENSDVVVHVGTHGYLEFLPGKGVGLSEEDFPEISIGNKPHFYIYTVKNPMEGA